MRDAIRAQSRIAGRSADKTPPSRDIVKERLCDPSFHKHRNCSRPRSYQGSAQSWQPPTDGQRCPSKWGAGDQRGAGNHMKPETVLRAARLIRTGEVIELGHVLSGSMPLPPTRRFEVHTKRTVMNPQPNRRGSNEEIVISEIGQVGTQFDGFSHQPIGNSMYNRYKGRNRDPNHLHQTEGRQPRRTHGPRRADRHCGNEGGGDPARHLRDHRAGLTAGKLACAFDRAKRASPAEGASLRTPKKPARDVGPKRNEHRQAFYKTSPSVRLGVVCPR
jgi:hypothetical protein